MIKQLVGKRIKQLRKQIDMSQESLAFACGLDRTYITSVENGKRNISIVNLEKICVALRVELKVFFDFDEVLND